jgi:hypothetical protein
MISKKFRRNLAALLVINERWEFLKKKTNTKTPFPTHEKAQQPQNSP